MPSHKQSRRAFLQSTTSLGAGAAALAVWQGARADDAPTSAGGIPVSTGVCAEHTELVLKRCAREREHIKQRLGAAGARPVTVATCQMKNHCGGETGKHGNLERMLAFIEAAAAQKCQMLAFPEMCLPGYFTAKAGTPAEAIAANHALADRVGKSAALKQLQEAARKFETVLAFGFCEHDGGDYYNAIGVIDADGKWLGTRRKNPLTANVYETDSFRQQDAKHRSAVFKTRHATVGVSNCFDGEFPESIRKMRLDGAELLLWCNAATGDPVLGHSSRINASACYAQANRMWVACANAVGDNCYGTSVVVGPSGEPLMVLPPNTEGLGVATIDLSATAGWEVWRDRLDPRWKK